MGFQKNFQDGLTTYTFPLPGPGCQHPLGQFAVPAKKPKQQTKTKPNTKFKLKKCLKCISKVIDILAPEWEIYKEAKKICREGDACCFATEQEGREWKMERRWLL
jgi:hypothetical protein